MKRLIPLMIIAALMASVFIVRARLSPRTSGGNPDAGQNNAPRAAAPYNPPAVKTISIAALVDRSRPVAARISGDISARIPAIDNTTDLETLAAVLSDTEDDPTVRNEVANLLARSHFAGLGSVLLKVLDNPRETSRFRAFAVQHLGDILNTASGNVISIGSQPDLQTRILTKLRGLLKDPDTGVKREALLALVRHKDPVGLETTVTWLDAFAKSDGSQEVRDLAIRCAQELNLRDQIARIRVLARDTNESVRIAAIVALSEWGDEQSRLEFIRAADSHDVRLQRCGTMALQKLNAQAQPLK